MGHSPLVGPTTWLPVADELLRRGLVGHSGAGQLLPAIADALAVEVAALVFVDSFLPPASGSVRLAPPDLMSQLRALANDGVLPPWSSWFGEDAMRELVPEERLRATLEQELPRLPLSYFEASVPLPGGWSSRPCAYLLFSGEPYAKSAARARDQGWAVAEIAGAGHLAMASETTRLAVPLRPGQAETRRAPADAAVAVPDRQSCRHECRLLPGRSGRLVAADAHAFADPLRQARFTVRDDSSCVSGVVPVDRNASLGEQRGALVGDLRRVRADGSGRLELLQLLAGQREHDPPESRARDRAPAHRARLAARVHRGLPRHVAVELPSGPPGELELGMGRDVLLGNDRVAVLGEHLARGAREQRSVRHVARGTCRGRQLDGPAQVACVCFRHRCPPLIVFGARRPWTRSDGERAFRHDDARPADPDLLAAYLHPDPAGTSHGVALLDEHQRAVGHDALRDRRVEESGVRDGGWIEWIEAVQVATLAADLREGRRQPWRVGQRAIAAFLTRFALQDRWRLLPARANGQLAFGCYAWDAEQGSYTALSLDVLTLDGTRATEVTSFVTPYTRGPARERFAADVLERFRLPDRLD